jgi:hypothetical protein
MIDKKNRFNDVEAECNLVKVAVNGSKFTMDESCGREGVKWTQKTIMDLNSSTLTISESSKYQGKSVVTYMRCSQPTTQNKESKATANEKQLSCSVNPGQAGVTTYLDEKLNKMGNSIRDFDGYVFKADKKIKINKRDILVGKLLRADGSVSEANSYADSDEWTCQ